MTYEDEAPAIQGIPTAPSQINRRDFIRVAGSGLTVLFVVDPVFSLPAEPARPAAGQGYPTDFNAYLHIGEDGRVTCFVGKVELGQGSMTSLAQLLAEDLDVALDNVDMVMGDTDLCPWDMGTFGSLSIRMFGPVLRAAAAEARAVLLQMAAERLQSPVDRLAVKAGVVTDKADPTRRVTYAQLTQGKRIERHMEKPPAVKAVPSFTVIGQSAARRDAVEKATGMAKYAGDMTFPDMLHAKVLRHPRTEPS